MQRTLRGTLLMQHQSLPDIVQGATAAIWDGWDLIENIGLTRRLFCVHPAELIFTNISWDSRLQTHFTGGEMWLQDIVTE